MAHHRLIPGAFRAASPTYSRHQRRTSTWPRRRFRACALKLRLCGENPRRSPRLRSHNSFAHLRTDDYYDILAANERTLDENRRVQRLAAEPPRNVQLQERYLQQAVNLGLIPPKFSPSPMRLRRSTTSPASAVATTTCPSSPRSPANPSVIAAATQQRPLPPPGYGGGRPSRDRIARELARADSAFASNTAAAALAATDALYRGTPRRPDLSPQSPSPREAFLQLHRALRGQSSHGGSDSELSKDSTDSTASAGSTWSDFGGGGGGAGGQHGRGRYARDWHGSPGSSVSFSSGSSESDPESRRLLPSERRELKMAKQLARLAAAVSAGRGGSDGGGYRPHFKHGRLSGESTQPRRCQRDGEKGLGGSSGGGALLREPTPAFLRRWRAARKKQHAKKQVVRFLLRTSEVPGRGFGGTGANEAGDNGGGAAAPPSCAYGRASSSGSGDGGYGSVGATPGVFIVYPGNSMTFPPHPVPYSLQEAVAAVAAARQQQEQAAAKRAAQQVARQGPVVQHSQSEPQQQQQQHVHHPPTPQQQQPARLTGQQQHEQGPGSPHYPVPARWDWHSGAAMPAEGQLRLPIGGARWTAPGCDDDEPTHTMAGGNRRYTVSSPGCASEELASIRWRPPPPLDGPQGASQHQTQRAGPGYPYNGYARGDDVTPQAYASSAATSRGLFDASHITAGPFSTGHSGGSSTWPRDAGGAVAHSDLEPGSNLHYVQSTLAPSMRPPPSTSFAPLSPSGAKPGLSPTSAGAPSPHATPAAVRSSHAVVRSKEGPPLPLSLPQAEFSSVSGPDSLPSPPSPALAPMTRPQLEAAAAFPADPRDTGSLDGRSSSLGDAMEGGPSFGMWAGGARSVGGSSVSGGSTVGTGSKSRFSTAAAGTAPGAEQGGAAGVPGVEDAVAGAPPAADAGQSLQSLRDQQSSISRDVQSLMQRLADMRGRLEK